MSVASDFIPAKEASADEQRTARRERWHTRINRAASFFELVGIGWLIPLMRIALGDSASQ